MIAAKVIAVCGSLRFQEVIMKITEEMELQGNCMLSIIYGTRKDKDSFTVKEHNLLESLHKQRIAMADAILVVNIDGYIGESTRKEIEYAKSLGKEIIYYKQVE